MKAIPMRLRAKLYVKKASDEQLDMMIDEWLHMENYKMLDHITKQLLKSKRTYFNSKLEKFI